MSGSQERVGVVEIILKEEIKSLESEGVSIH
jgi:hypothetical protein